MKLKVSNISGTLLVLLSAISYSLTTQADSGGGLWPSAGQNNNNSRYQKTENKIAPDNVSQLIVEWEVTTGGDVSATPAVDGNTVYFPDFAGNLYAVQKKNGAIIWQKKLSEYTGDGRSFSRTTPTIYGDLLIFGDQTGRNFIPGSGAQMFAVNKYTGELVWQTLVDEHPSSIITQSAGIHGDTVYVGVASFEEFHAGFIPAYECCTFRGSMLALDARDGSILWKTYMSPEGFSGNAIWGSSPVVDTKRNSVYIATGNNYSAPAAFLQCVENAAGDGDAQIACLAPYPDNYFDSVVALDLKTGAVKWSNEVIPFDVWTVACLFQLPSCPDPTGPDFDFGQAPMLMSVKIDKKRTDVLGVGQKSGVFWALSPDSGEIMWSTQVSPGGVVGGAMWGSAFDGNQIYISSANSEYKSWVLPDGSTTNAGVWTALNPTNGEINWQTANPSGFNAGGAVSVANELVYACSQDPWGYMYAMDVFTGDVLWSFASGGSCNAGAAIVNGNVYWGSGYAGFGPPNTPNNKFYKFGLAK
jgi:polyvinyl alcohol dehydrogenase (cytochrome)